MIARGTEGRGLVDHSQVILHHVYRVKLLRVAAAHVGGVQVLHLHRVAPHKKLLLISLLLDAHVSVFIFSYLSVSHRVAQTLRIPVFGVLLPVDVLGPRGNRQQQAALGGACIQCLQLVLPIDIQSLASFRIAVLQIDLLGPLPFIGSLDDLLWPHVRWTLLVGLVVVKGCDLHIDRSVGVLETVVLHVVINLVHIYFHLWVAAVVDDRRRMAHVLRQ